MDSLQEIHKVALTELGKRMSLDPVSLKYPFPERPLRALGLIKIDGEVYCSERFSRVVLLKVDFPFYFSVRNIFLFPKKEYNLPFFTLDIVFKGKKRLIVMDVHRTEKGEFSEDTALLEKLFKAKNKYSALLAEPAKLESDIKTFFSKAVCLVNIAGEQDDDFLNIFNEYLDIFLNAVENASPLSGNALEKAERAFQEYLITWAVEDPGVKVNKILFGQKGGIARGLDIFFGR
jgi:hypothetical protein